ncbi:MAG: metal ABC transporter ATP-binding protein [Alphaproteobacteria bacterium]|nr:metal ABC transporter ATP-binding protein [Alphaproteobacteria bacterium]
MSDPPLLSATGLSLRVGAADILKDVDFAIRAGEIVTLIGPNGSGKTSLLKALLGLLPAGGRIARKPGLRIGYVPQNFPRDRSLPLTAGRFLRLFAADAPAQAALERAGIAALSGRQLVALSGGEMARVLLARAIATGPELLILDEPLAGVDVAGEAALYHLIAELRGEIGCGVLLVSHDLHVVMAQADRVVCLNGHVCCEGKAEQVVRDPAFAQMFGPRVAGELALYVHRHDHSHDHDHDHEDHALG